MSINEITLKPVKDLLEANFFIPSYQRGYRWTPRLVEDLLNDLNDFSISGEEGFYYLQPLVIKRIEKYADDKLLEEIKKQNENLKELDKDIFRNPKTDYKKDAFGFPEFNKQ